MRNSPLRQAIVKGLQHREVYDPDCRYDVERAVVALFAATEQARANAMTKEWVETFPPYLDIDRIDWVRAADELILGPREATDGK